jgi:abortive infection bacteriophage resistance protein
MDHRFQKGHPMADPKPAKTYQEQIEILKSRGLAIQDESFASSILKHHNYYRLSAYRFTFTVPNNPDAFIPGSTFEQIWELYRFDRNLRKLTLEACERIEISSRSRWAYELGHQYDPLAYLNPALFKNPQLHAQTISKLNDEMDRSKEVFINHHKVNLGMDWPPSWVIAEVASFGSVSTLINQHKDPSFRQCLADTYGLDESVFCSLLHHLTILRNTAAHHSRLWNRRFTLTMKTPKMKPAGLSANFHITKSSLGNPNERKIYNTLVMLVYMLEKIEAGSSWPRELVLLLSTLPPHLLPYMGFPPDWKQRSIWSPYTS